MVKVLLAGIPVQFNNHYPAMEAHCREYLTDLPPQITIEASPGELEAERAMQPGNFSDGYLETVCCYRKAALALIERNVFVMHCSVVEVDGKGYAFLAHSGVGKTTQTRLWLEHFGPRARVINGDKPLICADLSGDVPRFTAWGTPWMGKERMGCRASVPLSAAFFLRRSPEPRALPATEDQTIDLLFQQLLMPEDPRAALRMMELADAMVRSVPFYMLECNMTRSSVVCAFEAAAGCV